MIKGENELICKDEGVFKMKKVSGIDTIEILKKGNIITLDDKMNFEPRYYRYNNEGVMEYSDNKTTWKKSNANINDFIEDNYIIIE